MYFGIMFILFTIGVVLAGLVGMVPGFYQPAIPYWFRFMMWFFGTIISYTGIIILWGRTRRLGVNHLINPGRPGNVLWLYFYADGECRILPSKRVGEGQLYNEELDSQIMDVKTYSLCDHKIRIVPEVVGHAVDLDYVLYVNLLETQYGFENLREARQGWLNEKLKRKKPIIDTEYHLVGDKNESLSEKIRKVKKKAKAEPAST